MLPVLGVIDLVFRTSSAAVTATCREPVNIMLKSVQSIQCEQSKDHLGNLLREHNCYCYRHNNH